MSINSNNINNEATPPSATSPKSASASIANNDDNSNAISSPNDISSVAEVNNANSGTPTPIVPRVLYGDGSDEDIKEVLNIIEGRLRQDLPKEGNEKNWIHRIFPTGDNITEGIRALFDQVHSIRNKLDSEQHSNKRSRTTISSSEQESSTDDTSYMIESIKFLQLYLNDKQDENKKLTQQLSNSNQKVLDLEEQLQKQKTKSDTTITELNERINILVSDLETSGRSNVVVYEGEEMTDHEAVCRELEWLSAKFETLNISHGLLKLSAANLQGQVARLNSDKSLLVDRERRSQAQLDRMKEHANHLHSRVAELNGMCDELLIRERDGDDAYRQIMDRNDALGEELESARNHIASKGEELNSARNHIASMGEELESARGEVASMGEELESARNHIASMGKELESARGEVVSAREELNSARNNNVSMGRELESAREVSCLTSFIICGHVVCLYGMAHMHILTTFRLITFGL